MLYSNKLNAFFDAVIKSEMAYQGKKTKLKTKSLTRGRTILRW